MSEGQQIIEDPLKEVKVFHPNNVQRIEIGEGGVKPPEEVEIILAFSLLLPRPLAQLSPPLSTVPTTLLYSYPRALQGFSTHTPAFLGFSDNSGLWSNSNYGEDVIVGVLDTGIWKEHPSFSDSGLDPVPSTWKGACEIGPDFPASSCNQKLIGAQAFYKGYLTHSMGRHSRKNFVAHHLSSKEHHVTSLPSRHELVVSSFHLRRLQHNSQAESRHRSWS
ncbi:hypothetical protein HID58_042358 [Brassica napus]|uniref:Uncharacterized protein n=1 Tax=Brassica napus TaxID=3708 RepID=A0ABQ8BDG1_BRANA|nr:hypothetical protein HID58_042358 [Brassica napus]